MPGLDGKRGRASANLAAVGLVVGTLLLLGPFGSEASAPQNRTPKQPASRDLPSEPPVADAPRVDSASEGPPPYVPIQWRRSRALGEPADGRLVRGVQLPPEGLHWVTWDPVKRQKPNRWARRWGTDRLIKATLGVTRHFAADHPNAPRILIGDLSRPHGGDFGTKYGSIGHVSHQNGLDVDVYYPRRDGREWTAREPGQVDDHLAQDLVDRFVAAGAEIVFVGPNLPLTGPNGIVVPLDHHDDHLHFRIPGYG